MNKMTMKKAISTSSAGKESLKGKRALKQQEKKRSGRKAAKNTTSSVNSDEDKPIDNSAIDNAMAVYNQRPADQPKRGRKPVREDIYISESLAKIEEMEQRL